VERAVISDDFRSLAAHASLLDAERPERLAVVHERIERSRRRRMIGASFATAGLVLVVLAGAVSYSMRNEAGPGPARPPRPSASTTLDEERPLVYAAGPTIYLGDRTFDAGEVVEFVEATDDGVVYVTKNDSRRLWFTDGSSKRRIGLVAPGPDGEFPVLTANPGSLVAWMDLNGAASPTGGEIVVYDTDRHEIVTSFWSGSTLDSLVAVNGDGIYYWPDLHSDDLMRFDQSTGRKEASSQEALRSDLVSNPRMLIIGRPSSNMELPAVTAQRLAVFKRVGMRLVASDSLSRGILADATEPTTLTDGRELQLRLPEGYEYDGSGGGFAAVQWLDNDHLALFAYHDYNELPSHVGDLLVCPVPSGTCREVVAASETPYVPPGDVP
jgi:hypothetical protein